MDLPTISRTAVPALTVDQMREVDRAMVEDLGIELMQMMENAGRSLADLLDATVRPESVTVLAGSGGNGGGGLVAARHLANRGITVRVVLAGPSEALGPVPRHQFLILRAMGIETDQEPAPADAVVDALVGYSLVGNPRGRAAELVDWANDQEVVVALDTPSGLDVTTGVASTPCIAASATLTLALPKVGLLASPMVGELFLADISVPPSVYRRMGLGDVHVFGDGPLVRLE